MPPNFPADPHEFEDAERTWLQEQHRQPLIENEKAHNGTLYTEVASRDQNVRSVPLRVDELHDKLVTVDQAVARTGRSLRRRFAIGLALLVLALGVLGWSIVYVQQETEDRIVAIRLSGQAQLLQATNRLAEAEPLMRRALAIDEQVYGAEHPNVAKDLKNLAQLLHDTNRLTEAEPMMRRALAIDEQSYGAEHPDVAWQLSNLAMLLHDMNRMEEAEPLMRRALAIHEHCCGPEHPDVAIGLGNLAALLNATNRLAEAEPLMRRALTIVEQFHGAKHPSIAVRFNNLAVLLCDTNRSAEAEPLMRSALAIDEESYGAEHPKVARDLNNLAQMLHATNRLAEAEPLMRRALAIDEQSYGADHPLVAIRLNNLARLLKDTNRLTEAEPLMRRCLAIFHQFGRQTGHEHQHMKAALKNYCDLLAMMKLDPAEFAKRLAPFRSPAGVAALLNRSGFVAFQAGEWSASIGRYREALRIFSQLPEQRGAVFWATVDLAAAQREAGQVAEAKTALAQVIAGLDERNQESALLKGLARYELALCERKTNGFEQAERWVLESIQQYDLLPASEDESLLAERRQSVDLYREVLELQGRTAEEIEQQLRKLTPAPAEKEQKKEQ